MSSRKIALLQVGDFERLLWKLKLRDNGSQPKLCELHHEIILLRKAGLGIAHPEVKMRSANLRGLIWPEADAE